MTKKTRHNVITDIGKKGLRLKTIIPNINEIARPVMFVVIMFFRL